MLDALLLLYVIDVPFLTAPISKPDFPVVVESLRDTSVIPEAWGAARIPNEFATIYRAGIFPSHPLCKHQGRKKPEKEFDESRINHSRLRGLYR